jgi:hypothetical protein
MPKGSFRCESGSQPSLQAEEKKDRKHREERPEEHHLPGRQGAGCLDERRHANEYHHRNDFQTNGGQRPAVFRREVTQFGPAFFVCGYSPPDAGFPTQALIM